MTISYPLSLPAPQFCKIRIAASSAVGVTRSPFTFGQQVQAHQGQMWSADVQYPPLERPDAEAVIAFLLALNGPAGTFLMGDPVGASPRGSWAGTPLVNGGSQAGQVLNVDGFDTGATGKAGDWIQLGSGASAHLHKLLTDFTVGSPQSAALDIWPRLREAPADNAPLTVSAAKGLWRLASSRAEWDIGEAQIYGVAFSAIEALEL